MTTSDLCGILRRRWYVVVLGLALLTGALHAVTSRPSVYSSQVDVVFLAPKSARYPNVIEQTSASLIAMAGLIEREVNKGVDTAATASAAVTLAGEGVRDGHAITLPNTGGQWAADFSRPVIDVQVVGPSEAVVRTRLASLVGTVEQRLAALQAADDIPRINRVMTSSAPASATVFRLDGNRKKAAAATLLLGAGLISIGAVGADRLLNALARKRRQIRMIHQLRGIA